MMPTFVHSNIGRSVHTRWQRNKCTPELRKCVRRCHRVPACRDVYERDGGRALRSGMLVGAARNSSRIHIRGDGAADWTAERRRRARKKCVGKAAHVGTPTGSTKVVPNAVTHTRVRPAKYSIGLERVVAKSAPHECEPKTVRRGTGRCDKSPAALRWRRGGVITHKKRNILRWP